VVAAAGVTVDLNDHRVSGTGLGAGIRVQAPDVTVRRGATTGFDRGVSVVVDDLGSARLRGLEIASNGRGVVLGTGFNATGTGSLALVNARVHDNVGAGVAASGWRFETVIRDTTVRRNGGAGIIFSNSSGGAIVGSRVVGNRSGVVYDFAQGGRVVGNLISGNDIWGLFGFRSGAMTVTDNAIALNGTPGELSRRRVHLRGRDALRAQPARLQHRRRPAGRGGRGAPRAVADPRQRRDRQHRLGHLRAARLPELRQRRPPQRPESAVPERRLPPRLARRGDQVRGAVRRGLDLRAAEAC